MSGKSVAERVIQALSFELLGIVLSTPLFAWLTHTPWLAMGLLTIANCMLALMWNVVFNGLFDRWRRRAGRSMTLMLRVAHMLLFEGGLAVVCVPFAAWWLHLEWWPALRLDTGLLMFFLPYTYLFHLSYDLARARWSAARVCVSAP